MSFKWSELERWLDSQKLPQGMDLLREPGWIEHFVRNMMTQSVPQARELFEHVVEVAVSESEHYVQLAFLPPEGTNLRKLHMKVREDKVFITGLPNQDVKEVELPKLVRPKEGKVYVKDSVVNLKLRKRVSPRIYAEYKVE